MREATQILRYELHWAEPDLYVIKISYLDCSTCLCGNMTGNLERCLPGRGGSAAEWSFCFRCGHPKCLSLP